MNFLKKLFPHFKYEDDLFHDDQLFAILNKQTILALTDTNGVIVEVNDNFCKLSQFSREELIGKTHKVVNSGFHSKTFWREFWKTLKAGEIWTGVICNRTKDQSYYWVKTTTGPIRDKNGKIIYYLALRGEISKWRESRAKSDRDQYLLAEASKLAKVGGWELDLNTKQLFWSDYTRIIHEVEENYDPNSTTVIEAYKEGWSQENIKNAFERCLSEGVEWSEELILITSRKKERWVRSKGFPVYEDGHMIRIQGTIQDITEEKAKTLETEKQFGLLKNVLNASTEYAFIATDVDGGVTTFNRGAERLLGYTADEVLSKKTPELWHLKSEIEERGEILSEKFGEKIQGFRVFVTMADNNEFEELEWTYVHKNGDYIPVSLTVTTVKNETGDIIGYLGIACDLTERKSMMQRVIDARRKFQGAFEQSGIGMAIVGLDGRWLEVNQALCKIVGYDSSELMALTFQDITHPDDLNKDIEQLNRSIEGKQKSYRIVKRYYRKDSQLVWVNLNVSLVRDDDENPLYFISQLEDITTQMNLQSRLADSENRLSLATRASGVGIWDCDLKKNELMWDDTMFELYGIQQKQDVISIEDWKSKLHPEDVQPTSEYLEDCIQKEIPFDTSFRIITPKNQIRHLRALATVHHDHNHAPIRMVGTNWDITEAISREQRLKELVEQAKQASEAKGQFLANMSHEIRTPINGISGMTSLLLDMENLSYEQRQHVEIIQSSSQSLMGLINDILDFSKVEAGKLELEQIEFSLRNALEEFSMILALRANQKGLTFLCSADPDVPDHLVGDPGRLRQILLNLAGNAIKFTPTGKVEVRVQCEPEFKSENQVKLRFIVSDTGIGISKSAQSSIFDEFSQADASTTRSFGGTGLGLAISKQLSKLMNGEIGVESELKKGSDFWFTATFEISKTRNSNEIEGLKDSEVLIIQPDESVRGFIEHQFRIWKVKTVTCADLEAVEELIIDESGSFRFEYILTDETIDSSRLNQILTPFRGNVKIILCTPLGVSASPEELKDLGVASIVHKPIRQSELYNSFRSLIGTSDQNRNQLKGLNADHFIGRSNRILLVEDNPVNQMVAMGLLEKFGMQVQCAADGNEAITLLQAMDFDVTLMDVQMPIMDGIKATEIIRTTLPKPTRDIPIIALTAHARVDDKKQCLDAGMSDYLSKPIIARRLYELLDEYLPERTRPGNDTAQASLDDLSQPPESVPYFDSEILLEIVLDDVELAKLVATQVIEDFNELIPTLIAEVESEGLESMGNTLHTLKGVCGNAGAMRLKQETEALENFVRNREMLSIQERIPEYLETLNKTQSKIQEFIG